jgi:hypothetical protein
VAILNMQSIVPRASACVHPTPIWGRLSGAGCGVFLHCAACASDLCPTCGGKVYRRAVDSKFKRAHVVHYTDKASKDSVGCAYTGEGETSDHAHAKVLLRDRIRDSIPIDSSTNTFTINVSTCPENAHTVCFTVELKAEYSCTVETVLNHDGSRRVGDVVIKDHSGSTAYIFEIFKTSRTKNSRPEPWFELAAGDVLKALAVPDGWTSRALDCVRFQNNNTNCSRPPCATCATLEVERREREAEASAARALQRQTQIDEWEADRSAEHALAALTLRDKIRALAPLQGTAAATSRFGVCVLLCSFHHEQYNHKRFDNFVLRPGFTCDVESDTGADKSRRVGAVVLKNAEGTLMCAFAISSGATRVRPEPWFECDASDTLEALSSEDWTKGKLRCVRFETNAPRCRRGSCTQCTTYRLKRARLKVEENEAERQRQLRILASLERNTKRKWVVLDDL